MSIRNAVERDTSAAGARDSPENPHPSAKCHDHAQLPNVAVGVALILFDIWHGQAHSARFSDPSERPA
jgi:hypothetical protein